MPITLPPDLQSFVDESVAKGEYRDADDFIVWAVARHRDDSAILERKLAALKRDIAIGKEEISRGDIEPWDAEATWANACDKLGIPTR